MILAQRIRSIQEKGFQKVVEDIPNEFLRIVNYCVMTIKQLKLPSEVSLEMKFEEIKPLNDKTVEETIKLHEISYDYEEAWREMRVTSMTDIN